MSLYVLYSRALLGIDAREVVVEAHLSNGLPGFRFGVCQKPPCVRLRGLCGRRSLIINSSLEFPARHITVNLAPEDLPRVSGQYNLAIALGILGASNQLPR